MKDVKTLKNIIIKFWSLLDSKQRKRSVFLVVVMLFGAIFETIGISAIIPFIGAVLLPDELLKNRIVHIIVEMLNIKNNIQLIYLMIGFIILIYILKNTYLTFYAFYKNRFEAKLQKELSTRSLKYYLSKPYAYFLDINSSEVIRGVNSDIEGVKNLYGQLNSLLADLLATILIAAFLIYTDWQMALGILIVAGFCFLCLSIIFRKILRGYGERLREAQFEVNKYTYQAVEGIKEIKVMRRMKLFIDKYQQSCERKCSISATYLFLGAIPTRAIETACIAGMMVVIVIKLNVASDDMVKFITNLSAFAVAAFRILPCISSLITEINAIAYLRPSLEACYNNMTEVKAFKEENKSLFKESDSKQLSEIKQVNIKQVDWVYPNSNKKILNGLSLVINRGEAIGVIGASGAGKSTLSDLLLGLFAPQKGTIEANGININEIPNQWSKVIGYVPQSVFLIDDTIRSNVAFGIEDENVKDEQIWDVLEQSQIKQFVKGLKNGLDTIVGERGVKFSGGQRQRIAIARALYHNPDLLILDEATSALDHETEKAVMESIEMLQGKKTLIIIAHRLTTIKSCDKIYEIKDGVASERKYEELI